MHIGDFREMYIEALVETRSVEIQLIEALGKVPDHAANPDLKQILASHLDETRTHKERLDRILERHNAQEQDHIDQSMQAIIRETEKWVGMIDSPDLRDAALIASCQCIAHYEIADYGTLSTWAKELGLHEDQQALYASLQEEKKADEALTALAKRNINLRAIAA
jgi:ferritin-like metal-binding protein YciE